MVTLFVTHRILRCQGVVIHKVNRLKWRSLSKTGLALTSILGYSLRLAFGKFRRELFNFMATANDLRRGMAINYNGDISRGAGHPAPHARQPARVRAGDAPQHPHRQILRRALQLDRKNRARADDDHENGIQLQGRRGFRLHRPGKLRNRHARGRTGRRRRRIISWKTRR